MVKKQTPIRRIQLENSPTRLASIGIMAFMVFIGIFLAIKKYQNYEDGFEKDDAGKWKMKEEYVEHVLKKMNDYEKCEVYYLIARENGYYKCPTCPGRRFYLHMGEIWKIGESCQGAYRYKKSFYEKNKVYYKTIFEGDKTQCLREQVNLLGNYPLSAENQRRPDRSEESMEKGRYKRLYPPNNSGLY